MPRSLPTDFNDLHMLRGLEEVRRQLMQAVNDSPVPPLQNGAQLGANGLTPPTPSEKSERTLPEVLRRYCFCVPSGQIWDQHSRRTIKQHVFKKFLGAEMYAQWEKDDKRREVEDDDIKPLALAAKAKGGGGLGAALERYVYLNPSASVWDKQKRVQVPISELRFAIADCFDDWIKHPSRKEVPKENLVFDPLQRNAGDQYINTFTGLALTPEGDHSKCINILLHLYHLCNKDDVVFDWLCKWLAFPLQHLGAKMATAVLMHSDVHGSGKSMFFDGVYSKIYGTYAKTYGQAQLESQYNDWISQTLFGVFEEVLSRSQKYSHTGTIKQMITGNKFYVEKKYLSGWEESNHMNCVFLSNEYLPLPIEASDRRFLVIWPEKELEVELQKEVAREIDNGGCEALYAWLLSVDLGDFNEHTKPPKTDAKDRIIEFGLQPWEVFLNEWQTGSLDVPYMPMRVNDLFRLYRNWCNTGRENILGRNKFSNLIARKMHRRRDAHWRYNNKSGKATFLIPPGMNGANDLSQEDWLGNCVQEWERKSASFEDDAA